MIDTPNTYPEDPVTHITTHAQSHTAHENFLTHAYKTVNKQSTAYCTQSGQPTHQLFAEHIATSHSSGVWTWKYAHNSTWRRMFYEHLLHQSLTATPLTSQEVKAYESQLVTSLPNAGFFPHPSIAYKNIALARLHTKVHKPLPTRLQHTSTLCVPHENYVTAHCSTPPGQLIGFYMGWVVTDDHPAAPLHTFQIRTPTKKCDISGWDNDISTELRHSIFPLSHINEYIWEHETNSNQNNLRAGTLGSIYSRLHITVGMELTLGHGLYDYDWSHYKRTLLEQALARTQLICIRHTNWKSSHKSQHTHQHSILQHRTHHRTSHNSLGNNQR